MPMPLIATISSPACEAAAAPDGARQVTPAPARPSWRERATKTKKARTRLRFTDWRTRACDSSLRSTRLALGVYGDLRPLASALRSCRRHTTGKQVLLACHSQRYRQLYGGGFVGCKGVGLPPGKRSRPLPPMPEHVACDAASSFSGRRAVTPDALREHPSPARDHRTDGHEHWPPVRAGHHDDEPERGEGDSRQCERQQAADPTGEDDSRGRNRAGARRAAQPRSGHLA